MTYVRLDNPAYNKSQFHPTEVGGTDAWSCSNIGYSFQSISNSVFPGEQEKYTVANWPGGTDNLTDGQAGNAGAMRAWNDASDTLGTETCTPNEVTITFDLRNAKDIVGKLMLYAAKVDKIYGTGWDGVWSDNAFHRVDGAWTNGLQAVCQYLRDNLPGKSVGGNGAWISWYRNGWNGTDPQGYLKMANANLIEGFDFLWGAVNQANVDSLIQWNNACLNYTDPKGMPRYNAYWDWGGNQTLARMRWAFEPLADGFDALCALAHEPMVRRVLGRLPQSARLSG